MAPPLTGDGQHFCCARQAVSTLPYQTIVGEPGQGPTLAFIQFAQRPLAFCSYVQYYLMLRSARGGSIKENVRKWPLFDRFGKEVANLGRVVECRILSPQQKMLGSGPA
jgi:hypothetical protein